MQENFNKLSCDLRIVFEECICQLFTKLRDQLFEKFFLFDGSACKFYRFCDKSLKIYNTI